MAGRAAPLRALTLHDRFELARAMAREEIAQRVARATQEQAQRRRGDAGEARHGGGSAESSSRWPDADAEREVAATVAWCWKEDGAAGLDLHPVRAMVADELMAAADAVFGRLLADVVDEVERTVSGVGHEMTPL